MNYSDLIPGSQHFTWHEALWLNQWQVHHEPSEDQIQNIIKLASKMDTVRALLSVPLHVDCWIRPILNCPGHPHHGQDYNALIGGASQSCHKTGSAIDYKPLLGMTCDEARTIIIPKLEEYELRMENKPGSNWVHNDIGIPHPHRYFLP